MKSSFIPYPLQRGRKYAVLSGCYNISFGRKRKRLGDLAGGARTREWKSANATKEGKRMVLENEKGMEEEGVGGRESRTEDSEGSRREELLYVTVVLAVRCGRSRRCLLIYWCDSFRRRAAFPKWWPPRALWVPFNAPATTSRPTSVSPASVRAREERERQRERERKGKRELEHTSRDNRLDGRTLANFHFWS